MSKTNPSRRTVLGGAGALAAAAMGLTACGSNKPAAAAVTTTSEAAGQVASPAVAASVAKAGPADWAALAKDLDGLLIRPGDSRYAGAKRLFQPQYDSISPSGVVYVSGAHDVATALAFARKFQLPVAARSGGHSYAGWSTGTGLVLDVGKLSGVQSSSGGATVGAGARLIDVYTGLADRGVTIPAGSCPTVGVTGLTLGGGIGVTGRAYGLTCDNLTGAEVVTANGSIVQADATSHADLYWALRGGGGGNFGVVTSLSFRTHPAVGMSYAFLSWPWSQAASVIRAWQAWAPSAPDGMWADLHLLVWADGQYQLGTTVTYLGSQSELSNLIDRLGVAPASVTLRQHSYLETMQVMAGVQGWTEAAAHLPGNLPGQNPAGQVTRESYGARSDIFNRPLSSSGAAALVAAIERYPRTGPSGGSAGVAFDAMGGAINRVGSGATAFVHRNALFTAQYTANYPNGVTGGTAATRSWSWLDGVWTSMRPYASGEAYQNYIDPHLTGWEQAYYGSNAARLRTVKRAYDPTNLFHFPQSVPLS